MEYTTLRSLMKRKGLSDCPVQECWTHKYITKIFVISYTKLLEYVEYYCLQQKKKKCDKKNVIARKSRGVG